MKNKVIRVGVDIRDLKTAKTGTKTYLEEIVKAFNAAQHPGFKFYFLDDIFPIYAGKNSIFKLVYHLQYQIWKQIILPIKAFSKRCDVVFCTDNIVPFVKLGYQTIPVFHDAFFFESPQNYGKIWLWIYLRLGLPAAKRSAFIVTPTRYSKQRLQYFTNIPETKFKVVHEGGKTLPTGKDLNPDVLRRFDLQSGNYILHVGAFYQRKNLPRLIEAFYQLQTTTHHQLKLVLAGQAPANKIENDYHFILSKIEQYGLQDKVILTGEVADQDLATLYKNALLYVFPSVNEGFGIPVLEAFNFKIPVLVANNTCLPEVGGDAVLQFDPFNIDAIFIAIKTALDQPELRKDLVVKGTKRLAEFSWQKAAAQLMEVFENAV